MNEFKILSIGNSFSVDTMEYVADIALALGAKKIKLGNLYVGGCSIQQHYNHATNDMAIYTYYTNTGSGWTSVPEHKISDAVQSEDWDWISIQHGTGDGSRYTSPESYAKLGALVAYVKDISWKGVKIAFNMTWIGEPYHPHHEIVSYGGDQLLMYQKVTELTRDMILPMKEIHCVSPTGTAIQNARTSALETLTRDGYHLSLGAGRYTAALTFLKALTGVKIDEINWAPEGVNEYAKRVAIESAKNAILSPFEVTQSKIRNEV